MPYTLVSERPEHHDAIELVLDRAFGPGRFAKTSERVRERGAVHEPHLSRVALEDDAVLGICRISRIQAGAAQAYFLGPLAVDPKAQHAGLGAALARDAVSACRTVRGPGAVILVGAEAFFRPLGFTLADPGRVSLPGPVDPRRLMWLELRPGGLDRIDGVVTAPHD